MPCAKHIKVSDIDLDKRVWLRDFSYEDTNGETISFKKGQPVGALMQGWIDALLKFEPADRERVLNHIEIWGQPRAWTDEKIASDVVEFIKDQWGQALVFADCLSSQWTERVLLRAWLNNVLWAPYAPEVTSTLQEPDTHEHFPLKAILKQVKSELHWALESEWWAERREQQQRRAAEGLEEDPKMVKYPSSWGPFECLYVISEGYARFCEKFKDQVPLQGLQANQMLRVRPSGEGNLELVRGTEDISEQNTRIKTPNLRLEALSQESRI